VGGGHQFSCWPRRTQNFNLRATLGRQGVPPGEGPVAGLDETPPCGRLQRRRGPKRQALLLPPRWLGATPILMNVTNLS